LEARPCGHGFPQGIGKRDGDTLKPKSRNQEDHGSFTQAVIGVIKKIPKGKVATYGQIAAYAGNPRGARQVVRVLHTRAEKDRLPWHRVLNRQGRIALKPGLGYEIQKDLLRREGVEFGANDAVNFDRCLWSPFEKGLS
jgi:methylated-DNA-protein-cysteine methyltransferase-like protein